MPQFSCSANNFQFMDNKWLKHKPTCQNAYISQKRSIYSNRLVSYVIVLLELLTVLLEYIDLSVSYFYKQEFILLQNILPIMLALCSMLSGTYYAHNYASIIGGSLEASIPAKPGQP